MINEKKGRSSDNCFDRTVARSFLVFFSFSSLSSLNSYRVPSLFPVSRRAARRSSLFKRGRVRDRCLSARTGLANRKRFLLEQLEANSVSETSR